MKALLTIVIVLLSACGMRSSASIIGDIDNLVMEPFYRWKSSPTASCESKELFESVRLAKAVAANTDRLDMRQRSAMYQLEIADGALNKKCVDFADVVYRDVIKVFVGLAYGGYRQRAEIGLADVREARQSAAKAK